MGRAAAGRPRRRAAGHAEQRPRAPGKQAPIPEELHPKVAEALHGKRHRDACGRTRPRRSTPRWAGPTIVTTGTASGKSLCFQLPTLDVLCRDARARALYLYPTKALAQDQARALNAFDVKRARLAIYDGDTPREQRAAIRRNGNVVLTNPDMLHLGILPNHPAWANFLSNLAIVVVDEAHVYRGVFGSHVGNVLRRLRRIAERLRHRAALPAGERDDRQSGRARRAPLRPRRLHRHRRATARPSPSARSRCGTRRSPTRSSAPAAPCSPRPPTCWPSSSRRARARSCS